MYKGDKLGQINFRKRFKIFIRWSRSDPITILHKSEFNDKNIVSYGFQFYSEMPVIAAFHYLHLLFVYSCKMIYRSLWAVDNKRLHVFVNFNEQLECLCGIWYYTSTIFASCEYVLYIYHCGWAQACFRRYSLGTINIHDDVTCVTDINESIEILLPVQLVRWRDA